jgi:hypothetical protein
VEVGEKEAEQATRDLRGKTGRVGEEDTEKKFAYVPMVMKEIAELAHSKRPIASSGVDRGLHVLKIEDSCDLPEAERMSLGRKQRVWELREGRKERRPDCS